MVGAISLPSITAFFLSNHAPFVFSYSLLYVNYFGIAQAVNTRQALFILFAEGSPRLKGKKIQGT